MKVEKKNLNEALRVIGKENKIIAVSRSTLI